MYAQKRNDCKVVLLKKNRKKSDLPADITLQIEENGKLMEHFYTVPTEEREKILDLISKTNELIDDEKK